MFKVLKISVYLLLELKFFKVHYSCFVENMTNNWAPCVLTPFFYGKADFFKTQEKHRLISKMCPFKLGIIFFSENQFDFSYLIDLNHLKFICISVQCHDGIPNFMKISQFVKKLEG